MPYQWEVLYLKPFNCHQVLDNAVSVYRSPDLQGQTDKVHKGNDSVFGIAS